MTADVRFAATGDLEAELARRERVAPVLKRYRDAMFVLRQAKSDPPPGVALARFICGATDPEMRSLLLAAMTAAVANKVAQLETAATGVQVFDEDGRCVGCGWNEPELCKCAEVAE